MPSRVHRLNHCNGITYANYVHVQSFFFIVACHYFITSFLSLFPLLTLNKWKLISRSSLFLPASKSYITKDEFSTMMKGNWNSREEIHSQLVHAIQELYGTDGGNSVDNVQISVSDLISTLTTAGEEPLSQEEASIVTTELGKLDPGGVGKITGRGEYLFNVLARKCRQGTKSSVGCIWGVGGGSLSTRDKVLFWGTLWVVWVGGGVRVVVGEFLNFVVNADDHEWPKQSV